MSAERTGTHSADGLGPGGITGCDGTHLTDTELDAWVDASAVPDAASPMPYRHREPSTTPSVADHHPQQPPSRDTRGNVVGDITLADGTVESVDALGAWADAFEAADPAPTPCPRCSGRGRIPVPCPDDALTTAEAAKGRRGMSRAAQRPLRGLRWHRRPRLDCHVRPLPGPGTTTGR